MRFGVPGTVVFCIAAWLAAISVRPATRTHVEAEAAKAAPCAAPEYHQFDFWVGDWDGFDVEKPTLVVARNHVDRILGGCVLREDYLGTDGSEGQSFSIYDASRKVWHQTWVTNHGRLLVIEGRFRSGEMILAGADRTADGKERRVRGIWKRADGGVRETAFTSIDGGKTWQLWFDMIFRPHKPESVGVKKGHSSQLPVGEKNSRPITYWPRAPSSRLQYTMRP